MARQTYHVSVIAHFRQEAKVALCFEVILLFHFLLIRHHGLVMFLFLAFHANTALKPGGIHAHIARRAAGHDSQLIYLRIANIYVSNYNRTKKQAPVVN